MENIRYFIAGLYQSIKSKRPDGTPYLNLCFGITGALLLNIAGVLLALNIWLNVNLIAESDKTYIICFLALASSIMLLLRILFPLEEIESIDVDPKDVKRMRTFFIFYYALSL